MLRAAVLAFLIAVATFPTLASAEVDPCKLAPCDALDCEGSCPIVVVRSDAVCAGYQFGTQSAGACALPKSTCLVAWVGWSSFPICATLA
jgi:hypothetical protein